MANAQKVRARWWKAHAALRHAQAAVDHDYTMAPGMAMLTRMSELDAEVLAASPSSPRRRSGLARRLGAIRRTRPCRASEAVCCSLRWGARGPFPTAAHEDEEWDEQQEALEQLLAALVAAWSPG
jgi:hypothetical protein